MLLTFGMGYWVFTAGTLGFTEYLKSWVWWFWYIRFFDFPYQFAGILASLALFYWLPRLLGDRIALPIATAAGIVVLIATQATWVPILSVYRSTEPLWAQTLGAAQLIGDIYRQPSNRSGVVNIPQTRPDLTYALVRFEGVDGKHIVGQLYDPFYDLPAGYIYSDHPQTAGVLMQCWLSETRTRLFVVDQGLTPNYVAFIADHPDWFVELARVPTYGWLVYEVDIPKPAAADCTAAGKAARP
jgi:hypothetical protein